MTFRGTSNKVAVFPECEEFVIASAKIFLENPVGTALIQSFQRGTTVMNLNPSDIGAIELPLLPEDKQEEIINRYLKEKARYKETIWKATQRWQNVKEQLYSELY